MNSKLLFLRRSLNLSQDKVAKKIGVNQYTISNWENNKNTPCWRYIKRLNMEFAQELETLGISKFLPTDFILVMDQ